MTYRYLPKYILRSPLLSFEEFTKITSKESIEDKEYFQIIKNNNFREALFLASPVLLKEATKWADGKVTDKNEISKLKISILKYYARMCFRSTPFGLFSGVSVGEFKKDEDSSVKLEEWNKQERRTRLDMFYLAELASHLAKDSAVKKHLIFSPNPSIYEVGSNLRYVEYQYENKKRKTDIVSVDNSDYLRDILNAAEDGLNYLEIIEILVDDEISQEESKQFIDELINSQILISDLEPYVTGPDFLEHIINILKRIPNGHPKLEILIEIKNHLYKLDEKIGNEVNEYLELVKSVDKLGLDYELNLLFQTDLLLVSSENQLSTAIAEDIMKAFHLLEKLTYSPKENNLSRFKELFKERYGQQPIPLGIALDVELGIGYGQFNQVKDSSPLIDDLILPIKNDNPHFEDLKVTPIHKFLEKERFKKNHSISLENSNINSISSDNNEGLSKSMTGTFEIVDVEGKEFIKFTGAGGSSAIYLYGRFCHLSDEINQFCQEIIRVENELLESEHNGNAVHAEIAHLPKSRMGNVIHRPILRGYEIPYMANSLLPSRQQLKLNDLFLRLNLKGDLELVSTKLKKVIIPKLATAHNYRLSDSQPIYTFLGEMQSQNTRNGVGIDYGRLSADSKFLPRLVFKNIIIKEATWKFSSADIKTLIRDMANHKKLLKSTEMFRKEWDLPEFMKLVDRDNELLIRLTSIDCILMWLSTVKNRASFTLSEYLFPKKIVKNKKGQAVAHQFNISFIKS